MKSSFAFRSLSLLIGVLLLSACGGAAGPTSPSSAPASPSTAASVAPKPASGSASAAAKPAGSAAASAKPAAASAAASAKPAGSASPAAAASTGALTHLVVAYGQPSMQNSILWIAHERGLFKKYGVDSEITQVTGPQITQGLIAGTLELIFSSPVSPMIARTEGGDTLMIASTVNRIPNDFVVNPKKIQKPEDLRGKIGGVQQAGDLSDEALRLALNSFGLSVNDVQVKTGFNTDAIRLEAMVAGAIDFAPLQVEARADYTKQGMTRLTSLLDINSPFTYGGVFTSNKVANAKPAAIQGAVKAIVEAVNIFHTQPDVVIPIGAKYMKLDPADVKTHYDEFNPILQKVPTFNRDDVVATLKDLELAAPKAKDANPDEFFTTKYLDELNSDGFIKQIVGAWSAAMRIVVYGPAKRVGSWEGEEIVDLNWAAAKYLRERQNEPLPYDMATAVVPANLRAFIDGGQRTLDEAQRAAEYVLRQAGDREGPRGEQLVQAAGSVRLNPPIPNPGSPIAAMGANYIAHSAAHRARDNDARPDEEVLAELRREGLARGGLVGTARRPVGGFWKLTETIAGHDDDVIHPARTERFDYEGEVAIVIGKPAKHVPASKVSEYIWGTTTCVDWSIRDGDDNGNRTFRHAKNFDTSASLGPSIVVGELDPRRQDMQVSVNGQVRQQYNSSGMTFGFAEIVEFLSDQFTLWPGFILSGGSGPGTAMEAGSADRFLKIGDVVEFSSPRIGLLRNRIVKEEPVSA